MSQAFLLLGNNMKIISRADTNLKFMLSPSICHNLPIVNTLSKANRTKEVSEDVLILFDVNLSSISRYLKSLHHLFLLFHLRKDLLDVPNKLGDDYANDISLGLNLKIQISWVHFMMRLVSVPLLLMKLLLLNFSFGHIFHFLLIIVVLLEEEQNFIIGTRLHRLLKSEHLVANVIAHLNRLFLVLELLS